MNETKNLPITLANLGDAINRSVTLPAGTGKYIGRGFQIFKLDTISNPHANLGNDAFTEVYFTTQSGNLYRIRVNEQGLWALTSVRDLKVDRSSEYAFPSNEIDAAVLEVGKPFRYSKEGSTTYVAAILAVNASRCYLAEAILSELHCDIRGDFDRLSRS